MFLDLKQLKRSGKDRQDFFFEYDIPSDLSDIPNVKVVSPVNVTGEIVLTGEHSAYIGCEVDFGVSGECTRCLTETARRFTVDVEEEAEENNADGYSVVNDRIDLGKIVEDAILTNLPFNFLCKEDCKGICPHCGVNLNEEDCKCKIEQGR